MLSLGLAFAIQTTQLNTVATLERPRLTYAEFGAWVQNRTHIPVTVSIPLRERKATVFVVNRPVQETMDRFAEAFELEWERTKTGLLLKRTAKLARDEELTLKMEAEAKLSGFYSKIELLRKDAFKSKEQVKAAYERWQENFKASPAAAGSYDGSTEDPELRAYGQILAKLNPTQLEQLLQGAVQCASTLERPGYIKLTQGLSEELLTKFAESQQADNEANPQNPPQPKPAEVVFFLKGSRRRLRLNLSCQVLDSKKQVVMGSSTSITPDDSMSLEKFTPLELRLRGWGKLNDLSVLKLPVRNQSGAAPHLNSAVCSLTDHFRTLHNLSTVPIITDGFRFISGNFDPSGIQNVSKWLERLEKQTSLDDEPPVARTSAGWLMIRKNHYWNRWATEPRESVLQPIDRPEGVTLEQAAAFAKALTPEQEDSISEFLSASRFFTHAPVIEWSHSWSFLRFWAVLTPSQRSLASKTGLTIRAEQSALFSALWDCLSDDSIESDGANLLGRESLADLERAPTVFQLRIERTRDLETFPEPFTSRDDLGNPGNEAEVEGTKWFGIYAEIFSGDERYYRVSIPLAPVKN